MKHIQNKLTRALETKDWRLVEEAWAMVDCMTNSKPVIQPYKPTYAPLDATHNID